MNRIYILLLLLFSVFSYSQTDTLSFETNYKDKYKEFDYYAKPSKTNALSSYFRSHINTDLLEAVKFKDTIESKNRIFLVFRLNDENQFSTIYANSPYSELNKSIVDAFKALGIEKINIPDKSPLNTYVLQILSKEEGKTIVDCSTNIIYDRLPIFDGCESRKSHYELKKCINKTIENHIIKNISFEEIQKAKLLGEIRFNVKFMVDYDGTIKNVICKSRSNEFSKELNRVVKLMPKPNVVATRNGYVTFYDINEEITIIIEPITDSYKEEVIKSIDTLYDANSDLALHFKKYITEKDLKYITLPLKQKSINISFGIDKKGRYVDVRNNLKMENLSAKINDVFKKYPVEKSLIESNDELAIYTYAIIHKEYTDYVFKTRSEPLIQNFPVFKGCEKSKNGIDLKNCMNENLSSLIKEEFDKTIRNKTKLKGQIRIFYAFKIDAIGNIVDVKVKSPNPYLTNELEAIVKNMPPAIKPGYIN